MMDTQLLEDALILLEERNLSAAAQRRNMTQPAFSRRIRALEYWIGEDLLVRGPNRVALSRSLLDNEPKIRALLEHLSQLRADLKNPGDKIEQIVIVSQHSLSFSAVPDIVKQAKISNPNWQIRLRTQNQDTAISMLLRHEADVLISYESRSLPEIPFAQTVNRFVWKRDAMVPVVGGEMRHRLTESGRLGENASIISFPADSFFGQIVATHEIQTGVALNGQIVMVSAFSPGVANLVLHGVGAAWVPHSLVHKEIIAGDAVILAQEYGRIGLDIAMYVNRSNERGIKFQNDLANLKH